MTVVSSVRGPSAELVGWLTHHALEFEIHEHHASYTALGTARAEHVSPDTFSKVVLVATHDGRRVMLVVDACDRVDLTKVCRAIDSADARLLDEDEMATVAPQDELGALPAVGALYGLPMYADHAVREDAAITFNAGSHRYAVRIERAGWERATGVVYADLARSDVTPDDNRPASDR